MLLFALLAPALAQDLTIEGTCPGTVELALTDLTPGGSVALLTGNDLGSDVVPGGPCAGLVTDLGGVTYRGRYTADAAGELVLTPSLASGACGSSVQLLDLATCTATNVDFVPASALSYAADIEPILNGSCGGCHGGSGGFTLSYTNLLASSLDVPFLARIEPFSPDDSYLWLKLEGTQGSVGGSGSQMPLVGSLTAGDLDLIEAWILDGALP